LCAERCNVPVNVQGCRTTRGSLRQHRSWYQCVVGWPGAVDSQTGEVLPLKRTSNHVATPWMVQGVGTCTCHGREGGYTV
jgi:hypothetical protein